MENWPKIKKNEHEYLDKKEFIDLVKEGPFYPQNDYRGYLNEFDLFFLLDYLHDYVIKNESMVGELEYFKKFILRIEKILDIIDDERKNFRSIYSIPIKIENCLYSRNWPKHKNKHKF